VDSVTPDGPASCPDPLARRDLRAESPTARTLVLDVPGWPGHVTGQHVDVRLTAEDGYTIDPCDCRSASAAGVLVMSRAPRPRVAKLMNQRMTTIRRFWKPIR
jgi:hypothetical protein